MLAAMFSDFFNKPVLIALNYNLLKYCRIYLYFKYLFLNVNNRIFDYII